MVTQESIFKKIGGLLQDLTDQYAYLQQHPTEQNGVHLELFEANVTYLLGHATILQKLTAIDQNAQDTNKSATEIDNEKSQPVAEDKPVNFSDTKGDAAKEEDTTSSSLRDEESALNYVDKQEVEATYFTPATANPEEKAEEYKLEDKRDKKEEKTKEEAAEDEKASDKEASDHKVEEKKTEDEEKPVKETVPVQADRNEVSGDLSNAVAAEKGEEEEAKEKPTHTEQPAQQEEATNGAEGRVMSDQRREPTVHQVIEEEKSVVLPINETRQGEQRPVEPAEPKRPMSLNELFSAQRKQQGQQPGVSPHTGTATPRPATNLQESPLTTKRITDIKSAVSLNDKLLFIKDLFNGYSLAYTEAIELLGRYDNFTDADAFLQSNYAQKNNWASKQATVDKLYTILKQRFHS